MNFRDPWLDVLRGVAVLMVVIAHLEPGPFTPQAVLDGMNFFVVVGGRAGVDLFFVLSGFLVSGLLFREWEQTGTVKPGRFLIRRGFKIYPPFWVVLAFIVAVRIWKGHGVPLERLTGELLFLQNYVGRLSDPHWTLAVEEHFYLLLAGLFMWQSRQHPGRGQAAAGGRVVKVFVLLSLGCLVARVLAYFMFPEKPEAVFMMTHARIDGLFLGVLLAWGCRRHAWHTKIQARVGLRLGLVIAMAAWWLVYRDIDRNQAWAAFAGMNITGGVAALLLLVGVGRPALGKNLMINSLAVVGRYSYSIYLWHMPWLRFLQPFIEKQLLGAGRWWFTLVMGVVGSLALGRLMAEVVERPALRLRGRWFPALAKSSKRVVPAI
ncbi:MAG: acyltransferase [Prosthecobacter sp.]